MVRVKEQTCVGQLPNGSSAKVRMDREIDQAALTVFDLIRQFNDPERHHLLQGYFKREQNLGQLEANLCKAEVHVDKARQQLRETMVHLKMLREAVDYLLSQSRT